MFDQSESYTLYVMEYDWPFYDGGVDEWCNVVASFITVGSSFPWGAEVAGTLGLATWLICESVPVNDEHIGDKNNFEDVVFRAYNNQSNEYTWIDNHFELKVKVD